MAYSEVSHAVKQISIKRNNLLNVARLIGLNILIRLYVLCALNIATG